MIYAVKVTRDETRRKGGRKLDDESCMHLVFETEVSPLQ